MFTAAPLMPNTLQWLPATATAAQVQVQVHDDIANGIGHALHPELVQCAVQRLQTHIPHRTWAAAMGAVPALAERQPGAADD